MDSLTVFLHLDSRKLYIVSTPMVDNDPVLLHKTKQISFSKFISSIFEYEEKYVQIVQELTDEITKYVNSKGETVSDINKKLLDLEHKMSDNLFALIVLNIIKTDFLAARIKGENKYLNILLSDIERKLEIKYASDSKEIKRLLDFIENDFCFEKDSEFSISSSVVLKVKNKKRLIMIPIEDSLEPLINAIIYLVYAGNLWVHSCPNCGKHFLSDSDAVYCEEKACQHHILLDKWKNDWQKNMENETKHILAVFRAYLRKQKKGVKDAGASEQTINEIEKRIKELGKEASERASIFKDTNTNPDKEFIDFCMDTRKQFKEECDKIKKELEGK